MNGVNNEAEIPTGFTDTMLTPTHFLEDNERQHILNVAPAEGNRPLSVFRDEYSEELAYRRIFLGQPQQETEQRKVTGQKRMSDLLREACTEARKGNHIIKKQVRDIGSKFLNSIEISAQEAVYIVLQHAMRKGSRQIVFVNTSPPDQRVELLKPLDDIQEMDDDCEDNYTSGLINSYSKCPAQLKHLTLADWAAWYDCTETLEGYVHLINGVKTAARGSTKNFDLKLQTTGGDTVRMLKSQPILHGDKIRYKKDSIVADETVAVKLVLWEDTTDKPKFVNPIQNCKIRVFDVSKFLKTNEFTKIKEIDEIPIINLATPELQDNIINGQCLGVDLKCTTSCICCNKTTDETNDEINIVTCLNCSMTLIKDVF
ncbi:unnamed protein product [Porites evermanni]|uniref:Uncharacterized protein n=1 Tax=Porites evermanni TaxID=104178 RepID=A0ABN8Q749_9CNID|nr:unnamed protein product [Porites evermanni]